MIEMIVLCGAFMLFLCFGNPISAPPKSFMFVFAISLILCALCTPVNDVYLLAACLFWGLVFSIWYYGIHLLFGYGYTYHEEKTFVYPGVKELTVLRIGLGIGAFLCFALVSQGAVSFASLGVALNMFGFTTVCIPYYIKEVKS